MSHGALDVFKMLVANRIPQSDHTTVKTPRATCAHYELANLDNYLNGMLAKLETYKHRDSNGLPVPCIIGRDRGLNSMSVLHSNCSNVCQSWEEARIVCVPR